MRHLAFHRRGRGRPLLLLPGAGADATCWDAVAALLCPAFELHLAEIAGFAGRPSATGALWPAVRDELLGYASNLEVPPLVMGHSWGGFLAWSAMACGLSVTGAIVIDTMPALGALIATGADAGRVAADRAATLRAIPPEELGRHLAASIRAMTPSSEQADRLIACAGRSDPRTIGDAMEAAWCTDLRPALASWAGAPVRVVVPGDEHLEPAARAHKHGQLRRQVEGLPRHRLIDVPRAGHYVMIDQPADVAAIVHEAAEDV